jgi:thiopeptide-type bacteriocin biosynthesis protein
VSDAWAARADALAAYHRHLTADTDSDNSTGVGADVDAVLESLLHMHHNRALGIDPGHERSCRRLARQTAVAWHARQAGDRQ